MKKLVKNLSRSILLLFFFLSFARFASANADSENSWKFPDAVISTQSLSDLPKDILKQSLLKQVLTEDFAFYYEDSSEYLSLKGALKRIAFEHEMTLFDQILNYVMSEPAEMIFWKTEYGRLDEFMLSIERSAIIDLMTFAAKISTSDSQLTKLEERTEGTEKFTIYKLKFGEFNQLFFTNFGNKLIVYTNYKMPIPTQQRLKTWLRDDLFPSSESRGSLLDFFSGKGTEKNKHQLYLNMHFLTFGYQKYLANMDYLAFSFNEKDEWKTHGLMSGENARLALKTDALWKAVPRSPVLCLSLPLNKTSLKDLFLKTFPDKPVDSVVNNLSDNLGTCWFADSQMFTPLYVINANSGLDKEFLKLAFNSAIGPFVQNKPAPATVMSEKDKISFLKFVPSKFGNTTDGKKSGKRGFKVKLSSVENYLVFSADSELVDQSAMVISKKSPSLSETLSGKDNIAAVLFPSKLSLLLKKTIKETLKDKSDSLFKETVTKRFFPSLDKMNSMPNLSLEWPKKLPEQGKRWEELSWASINSK